MPSKIAVIGDINGQISEVFSKLRTLQAKQSFAFVIVAGSLFADPATATEAEESDVASLLAGDLEVPVQTYVALGRHELPPAIVQRCEEHSGDVCNNLTLLGRRGTVKTSEGFRIVAVGGKHVTNAGTIKDSYTAAYTDQDVNSAKGYNSADILVTSEWPANIHMGSKIDRPSEPGREVQSIAELCVALKPRYHFSTSKAFYEREPFFHDTDAPRPITRFLSLGTFSNPTQHKWIYAFSLEPSAEPPTQPPPGTTAPPFTRKRKMEDQAESYDTHRFSNGSGHRRYENRPGGKRRHVAPPAPRECFFCLSNPACETHMIGSLGEDAYLTVAKGPLTTKGTFPSLNFPAHMLIIPYQHAATMSAIDSDDTRRSTSLEVQKYRDAFHTMLADKSADSEGHSQLGAVTFEISRAAGVHHHWQMLPMPVDMIQRGLVEAAFDVEAENLGYPKFVRAAKGIDEVEEGDFFKTMIWSEALRKEMALPLDNSFRFDLQFGRRVLGKLLGLEGRTHWQDCKQPKEEETRDCEAFKAAFAKYDFSLEA